MVPSCLGRAAPPQSPALLCLASAGPGGLPLPSEEQHFAFRGSLDADFVELVAPLLTQACLCGHLHTWEEPSCPAGSLDAEGWGGGFIQPSAAILSRAGAEGACRGLPGPGVLLQTPPPREGRGIPWVRRGTAPTGGICLVSCPPTCPAPPRRALPPKGLQPAPGC